MLTPDFYRRYRALPARWLHAPVRAAYLAWMRVAGTRIHVEGWEKVPRAPCLLATNATQKNDWVALRWVTDGRRIGTVSLSKGKNYHHWLMGFLLERLGVVPIASRGYLLMVDASRTLGRRPTEEEYRSLRDHLDRGAPLPPGLAEIGTRPREIFRRPFDPAREDFRGLIHRIYRESLAETLRLSREAVAAGWHVQVYPEGTVSPWLGRGRPGAVQLALALGLPIVPIGMSGCPEAFFGDSPITRRGQIHVRVGEPMQVPRDLVPPDFRPFEPEDEARCHGALQGFTDALMDRIEALLDPRFRRRPGEAWKGKGSRAFL